MKKMFAMHIYSVRNFLFPLAGLLAFFLSLLSSCTRETDHQPNIILIITDDQGYGDIAAHGNKIIHTPNLDDFYGESVRFRNFHVGTTCAPTRAGLMTGRNCNRNGVWHTIGGCSLLNEREETMADVFSTAGYATGMFGKWHLGDTYPFRPQDRGFQEVFYHGGGGVTQTPDFWQNDYFDDTYYRNGKPEKTIGYCTDIWFDEALSFIDKHRSGPFFCYLSTNAPHSPFNVPEKYLDIYGDADLLPHQQRFYGMISNIDENFGILLDKLEEWELEENTIVIFMTDNGTAAGIASDRKTGRTYGYNAGMRGKKGSQYDGGHRVPLMIRWNDGGWTGGIDIDELAAHVDLLPTLAVLCSVPYNPTLRMDGISLAGVLAQGRAVPVRMLVTDTQRQQWPEQGRNSCVMESEWRLVNGDELYSIKLDPGQKNNMADQFPDRVKKMKDFYNSWWTETESEFEYSHIKIGSPWQNPVILTCHDMHTEDDIPWHQGFIRKGAMNPQGYYSIEVAETGDYEILLGRWPFESGLPMREGIEGRKGTTSTDAIPEGSGKIFTRAICEVEGVQKDSAQVDVSETGTIIRTTLTEGRYRMKFNFQDGSGADFAAYYISLKKL